MAHYRHRLAALEAYQTKRLQELEKEHIEILKKEQRAYEEKAREAQWGLEQEKLEVPKTFLFETSVDRKNYAVLIGIGILVFVFLTFGKPKKK